MGIRHTPAPYIGAGFEQVWEKRTFEYDLGEWKVTIEWEQNSTHKDGQPFADTPVNMRLHFLNHGMQMYRGTIWLTKDGKSYDPHAEDYNWRKSNKQRESAAKFEDIKPLVDQVWAYYQSPEGQFQMFRQSMKAADREIAELQAQIDTLKSWRLRLGRAEDQLIRESPAVVAMLVAEHQAKQTEE